MHWLVLASLLAADPSPAPEPGRPAAPRAEQGAGATPGPMTPEERKKLEEQITKELGGQGTGPAAPPPPGTSAPEGPQGAQGSQAQAQGAQGQTGGNPFARLMLLPDVSAIGSAALAWNQLDTAALSPRSDLVAPAHKVQPIFEELELALQAVVDPYARADVFIAFASAGVAIEEAYLTTLQLPAGLQARAGQFYAPFGRQNQQHAHVFEFIDFALPLARLLGPDQIKGAGVDVAWLAPTPWFAELHLAYQALTPAFQPDSRNAGTARLVQFFDVGDASTLGVGASASVFDEPGTGGSRQLVGGDVYLKIRPLRSRSYVALQGEILARRLTGAPVPLEGVPAEAAGTEWGGYAQAVYRDGPFFAYGARYERAPALGGGPEHRVSLLASWLPSEFQRLRVQVSYDRLPGGQDGFEALAGLEFAVGAHGAHPF